MLFRSLEAGEPNDVNGLVENDTDSQWLMGKSQLRMSSMQGWQPHKTPDHIGVSPNIRATSSLGHLKHNVVRSSVSHRLD